MNRFVIYIIKSFTILHFSCINSNSLDEPSNNTVTDSNQVATDIITKTYINALQDYILNIGAEKNIQFDTLYLINRKNAGEDNFPDINLPQTINNVGIVMLSEEEANTSKKLYYKQRTPCINLIGWINKFDADFMFVTFFHDFQFQFNYHL
ncbi:MAG: hypothetical protein AB7O73_12895 [Bacteroidia bacterium]